VPGLVFKIERGKLGGRALNVEMSWTLAGF